MRDRLKAQERGKFKSAQINTLMDHLKTAIREFVVTNFLFGDAAALQDDASFIQTGVVDSTGILELVLFLETTYHIKLESNEIIPENLDGVIRIAQFLSRKMAGTTLSSEPLAKQSPSNLVLPREVTNGSTLK